MALQIFGTNSIGVGVRAALGTTDDLFVAVGVTVGSTDGNTTIVGTGNTHNLDIQGSVTGLTRAIEIGDSLGDVGQTLLIGEDAYVAGVSYTNTATVTVIGNNNLIDNRGTIHGYLNALCIGGDDASATTTILNSGLIEGSNATIFKYGGSVDTVVLTNTGEIRAEDDTYSHAYFSLSPSKDLITNSGLMIGKIGLGQGDDLYDGRGGRVMGQVAGYDGIDKFYGGGFTDDFLGEAGNDLLDGGPGGDLLDGGSDQDVLTGGAGNDMMTGGAGADAMSGGPGNDIYGIDNAGDVVAETGGDGIDLVNSTISFSLSDAAHAKGAIERLTLAGSSTYGTGNGLANVIAGNTAINLLNGLAGNDILFGDGGNDSLFGDAGNDVLRGDAGLDRLYGGLGNDNLAGGAQFDYFIFNTAPHSSLNRDVVADFVHGGDKFWMENAIFSRLGASGAMNGNFFRAGAAALDANDFIVYDRSSGALSYDLNGNEAGKSVMFAVLANKPVLTASDFAVM